MPSSTYHSRGNAINGKIDFSPYAKLYASCIQNGITYTLYKDISSVETEGYINISLHYSNDCYVDLYPSTLIGPNYLAESKITDLASISGLSSGLNVYYTKIWLEK